MQNRDHKLINLETFVNEKLRVTKGSGIPNLISFLESKDKKEFESKCKQLLEYLKNDSGLPMAELEVRKTGFKQLLREYENDHDTFLWVDYPDGFFYGTWDDTYCMTYSTVKNSVKNYTSSVIKGFKDLVFNNEEISKSGGVYIITENSELMKQIDYLIQKAEPYL